MAPPTVRRRRLGLELRRLREQAKLTLEEVEARTGLSASKLSRLESAARGARSADVEQLLSLFGADQALSEFLLTLAKDGSRRGWWQTYDIAPVYADLIGLEADAASVSNFEPLLIPGLLQTAAYARAAIGAVSMTATPEEISPLVEVRMARQSVLTRPNPLKLRAIIHEAALTARVSGAGVMRDQLQRLLDVAEYPHVTIQVLPATAELHPGATGGFAILGFGQPGMDVVLLEHLNSSLYIEEPAEVDGYTEAFERLTASALPFDQSLSLIADHKKDAHQ
ncbi:helix-turn-helix domain-containing protein [Streptomyces sp. ISL-36]|uniref:helix-turn-helix domain-containing protein n=1 Tax=Streptomyces sp. ISL-36 TaxID=2819182 RepID=UPI001BE578E5|nr:helix-turn-helix transcriptional regulator [Streptomyces sp. ISL-36]MBT2441174.1 helix-turn-helix domain-containing protein [Streptomyces sp. ISL-36]